MGESKSALDRVIVIPFDVTIPDHKRVPEEILLAEFEQEKTGIFRWMIEGWKDYQQNGLNPPESVLNASVEYRKRHKEYTQKLEVKMAYLTGIFYIMAKMSKTERNRYLKEIFKLVSESSIEEQKEFEIVLNKLCDRMEEEKE